MQAGVAGQRAQRRGAKVEKHTCFRALDGKLIGVGYYNR